MVFEFFVGIFVSRHKIWLFGRHFETRSQIFYFFALFGFFWCRCTLTVTGISTRNSFGKVDIWVWVPWNPPPHPWAPTFGKYLGHLSVKMLILILNYYFKGCYSRNTRRILWAKNILNKLNISYCKTNIRIPVQLRMLTSKITQWTCSTKGTPGVHLTNSPLRYQRSGPVFEPLSNRANDTIRSSTQNTWNSWNSCSNQSIICSNNGSRQFNFNSI